MIVAHEISKEVGKGLSKRLVLDELNWVIRRRSKIIILGHRGSGKSTLLNILAGIEVPTSGWVERYGTVSLPGGFLRYAQHMSIGSLIGRLAEAYRVDSNDVFRFIQEVLPIGEARHLSVRGLSRPLRAQLNQALIYALPCDYYLFDGSIKKGTNEQFGEFCSRAYEARSKQAGTILATSSTRLAQQLAEAAIGAILYQGSIRVLKDVEEAVRIFEALPPDAPFDPNAEPEEGDTGMAEEDS